MKRPFIHLFSTSEGFYLYDVNTSQILQVSKDAYNYMICEWEGFSADYNKETALKEIDKLISRGFLKDTRVRTSEHPASRFLKEYCNNFINTLILQVTQNCNLRCEYCIYSGKYRNRIGFQILWHPPTIIIVDLIEISTQEKFSGTSSE